MDMRVSGGANIAAGDYDNISISGSGRLDGPVRCASFHISGASSGDSLICKNEIRISGGCKFTSTVEANAISVSGSFSCGGPLRIGQTVSCSGSIKSTGSVKCTTLSVTGYLSTQGDVEAETAKIRGKLDCTGLLNAEEITIESNEGMEIGSIGGSKIVISRYDRTKKAFRLPLFASLIKSGSEPIYVKTAVEGDVIALENVRTPRVSGRIVAIGEDCEIELVQYSEQIEISPNAKVGRTEKIG